ncbi:hypothetical protein GIB67_011521 [Kingdonia uniflora]|uniref:Uncharacterized protein n=1 Tax=Kingdonia uniflora TaxID=39325 RepID=A0A7J7NLY0_9MAGN|nr:hypothetical protein GIB67_011521 [Kingdonia uniflora]
MSFVPPYKLFVQHCLSFLLISFGRLTVSFVLGCLSFVFSTISFDLRNYFRCEAALSMHTNYLRATLRK